MQASERKSIEPGKLADLIAVDQDLFQIDPHKIDQTKVLLTVVEGKVVYAAEGWNKASASGK